MVLDELVQWVGFNKIHLNLEKIHYMIFHTPQARTEYDLNIRVANTSLTRLSSTNFLGMHIDETLTWKTRCDNITSKINKVCYQIRNFKSIIGINYVLSFYYAQVYLTFITCKLNTLLRNKNIYNVKKNT